MMLRLFSFLVVCLLALECVQADHCLGGAVRWWTDNRDPDALTVTLVVRQLWRSGPEANTHSRETWIDWGDRLMEYWAVPEKVLGHQVMADGIQVEITEHVLSHTYYEWNVYNARLISATRSVTPNNVGGGTVTGIWTIVTNENSFYESPYLSDWNESGEGLLFQIEWNVGHVPHRRFPITGNAEIITCRTLTPDEADIIPKKDGLGISVYGLGENFYFNTYSQCDYSWNIPANADVTPHWALPIVITNSNDHTQPDSEKVSSWFDVPIQLRPTAGLPRRVSSSS